MAAATVTRKLVITSDTSGLQKGARDVQSFGQQTESAAATLKRMKGELDPAAYKTFAAGMKPAIEAERQMASMTKALTAELKPFGEALRKQQTDNLKAAEAVTKLAQAEIKRAEALRRAYDDTYANAQRYLKVEEAVAQQIELRNLSAEQGNVILATAAKRFDQMGKGAEAANQNVKLTSGQVQGLGFQINDMGTMLAMGASPFQILASQAGQVVQVLQEGGGVKASIGAIATAVGGFVTSLGPVGIALGATTAAAGALWLMSDGPEAKAAQNSMDAFKRSIDAVRDSFGEAGRAADLVFSAGAKLTQGMALGQLVDSLKTAKDELKGAVENLGRGTAVRLDTSTLGSASAVLDLLNGELRNTQAEIRELYGQFSRGEIQAKAFVERMAQIQIKPGASDEVKELAGEMRRLGTDVLNAATNAEALQAAMDAIVNSRSRLPKPAAQDRPDNAALERRFGDRINPDVTDDMRRQLEDQAAALTKTETATRSYSDAVADQKASIEKSVAELRLQVDMYGQSEGAIAAARFKLDAMTEAQRAANDAKANAIDPALVDQINREASEIGRLTDQIRANTAAERERQKAAEDAKRQRERVAEFSADLEFERSILGFSEAEQEIRQTIRNLDVDFDSFEGQRLAAAMRFNDSVRAQQGAMADMGDTAKDVFGSIIESLSQGGELVDNLAQALGGLGQKLASAGLERMLGGLFGTGGQTGRNNVVSILGGVAANSNIPIPTARPVYEAATVAASRMTNASSSLADVLKDGANRIGTTARDLAAVISFETGGSFSTSIRGGAGNRHIGLIQFGPTEQKRYGAAIGQTLADQMDAVVGYLQDRGFKPGMDIYDLYSTINAGRPGRYGASDAVNGGTWGSVREKVDHQFATHFAKADSILGGTTRDLAKGVSKGVQDGIESYGAGRFDTGYAGQGAVPGISRGQAAFSGITGLLGLGANGYASGSPISGGISGLMGGYELGGSLGSMFPGLGAAAGPVGMALGAAAGCVGGKPQSRSQREARSAKGSVMTALNVVFKKDRVHLLTDGAVYSGEGVPLGFMQKAIAVPSLHAVVASQGTALGLSIFAQVLTAAFVNFDHMLTAVSHGALLQEFRNHRQQFGTQTAPFRITVAGWSAEEKGPRGFSFDSTIDDDDEMFQMMNPTPGEWVMVPSLSLAEERNLADLNILVDGYDFVGRFDPVRHGIPLMEAQRRMPIKPLISETGAEVPIVGGYILATEVDAHGITQKVIHRWNDDVGRIIEPDEFVRPEGVARLKPPTGLSRQQRRAWEKKHGRVA